MLIYRLQSRVLKARSQEPFAFPNTVHLELKLGPAVQFGAGHEPSRVAVLDHKATLIFDANSGRTSVHSSPGLGPLKVSFQTADDKFELNGDVLTHQSPCESITDVTGAIQTLYYLYPVILNVYFSEPPIVLYAKGRVGDIPFSWEHAKAELHFRVVTQDSVQKSVLAAFQQLHHFDGQKHLRLVGALQYFHVATRLLVTGTSVWEFMSEAILNLCKALQILFGHSNDKIRSGLSTLGYSSEEIEKDFVLLLILRSHFDVAHPRLATLGPQRSEILYRYLSNIESRFRDLFSRVFERMKEGKIVFLLTEKAPTLDAADESRLETLIDRVSQSLERNGGSDI